MARIKVDNVTKIFGHADTAAVKNLTLDIADKEIFAMLGPSGCGKTTTMRMIAGLEKPTEGRIYIDERDVTDMSAKDRDVAMVFQFAVVYDALPVYDNIAAPLKARGMPRSDIDRTVLEVADLLDLTSNLKKMPKTLDMGGRQRVALARAIARRPKVYLLDEPLTNIDAKVRVEMRAELKKLQRELGQTIIYVTHDQSEAMTMADRILVMDKGVTQQCGTPEEIYAHPTNRFVANFIGEPAMSLLHATYERTTGVVSFESAPITVENSLNTKLDGGEVQIGIRPEHILVSTEKTKDGMFETEVVVAEPLGNRALLELRRGNQYFKAKVQMANIPSPGDKAWALFERTQVRFFDEKTGESLA